MSHEALLREMYRAFNARDIDAVLAVMTDDVDWPNGWEGGRVVGRAAVRNYWERQWAAIDPTVEPAEITVRPDGSEALLVRQMVRGLDGTLVADGFVRHVYAFDGDRVTRMDIEAVEGE